MEAKWVEYWQGSDTEYVVGLLMAGFLIIPGREADHKLIIKDTAGFGSHDKIAIMGDVEITEEVFLAIYLLQETRAKVSQFLKPSLDKASKANNRLRHIS